MSEDVISSSLNISQVLYLGLVVGLGLILAFILVFEPDVRVHPKQHAMPGVKCPTCAANGKESWVIPGIGCGYCGTGC